LTGPPGEKDASYSPNSLEGLRENEEKRDIFGGKNSRENRKIIIRHCEAGLSAL